MGCLCVCAVVNSGLPGCISLPSAQQLCCNRLSLPAHPPARLPTCPPAVVVTPLLSLMQDQVQALNGLASGGVPTTYLSSQQTLSESRVRAPTRCVLRPACCRCVLRWCGSHEPGMPE